MPTRDKKKAVIVLGMHRSGTSALAGVLSFLGIEAPRHLMAADEGNPKGYWESTRLMEVHDRLLAEHGSSWRDWRKFEPGESAASRIFLSEFPSLMQQEFGEADPILVKDPRICRFVPLWLEGLKQSGYDANCLIPVRNPLEVARSLQRRDKMSITEGLLLWLRHCLDAEHDTRHARRVVLRHDRLLQNWRQVVDNASAALDLEWPRPTIEAAEEIDRFLTAELRHNVASREDLARHEEVFRWVVETYDALSALADRGEGERANSVLMTLDRIRGAFDDASEVFGALVGSRKSAIRQLRGEAGGWKGQGRGMWEQQRQPLGVAAEMGIGLDADDEPYLGESAEEVFARAMQREDAIRAELVDASQRLESAEDELRRAQGALQVARSEIAQVNDRARTERQRYHMLAQFIWKSDFAARRRSVIGAAARLFGRSKLAKSCRLLNASGLFDRRWYKRANPDVGSSEHEPVVHYLLFGAFEGRRPNPVFDSSYYLEANHDVRASGINPLVHYIEWGESELRRPSPDFDPASYLHAHPELKAGGGALLRHFLEHGVVDKPVVPPFRPSAPDWSAFEALAAEGREAAAERPVLDVIIPVYRGYDDTLACIHSVLTSENDTPYELVVIDDASPEPELSAALDKLAQMGLISLLRNEKNLGFVGTVNRGMALHPDRDVLLLNSDTLVFNDWVDRIRAHAGPDVASVTPFTNNGTICSYPEFCRDNPGLLEMPFEELDRLAAGMNRGQSTEIPTGIGLCMYITRAALDKVGLFDVETFGRGYGEENDFSVSATKAGLRNLHAFDVFVFHSGETSFGADASKAKKDGLAAVVRKHPNYLNDVQAYLAADPARAARMRLDVGRLLKAAPASITLCITHMMGGGIQRYIRDRAMIGAEEGELFLLAVPASPSGHLLRLMGVDGRPALENLPDFEIGKDDEKFVELLRSLPLRSIEVHSTVGWSAGVLDFVPAVAQALDLPFDMMAHDYVPICPQINLIDESGVYCGEQGEDQCRSCMRTLTKEPRIVHPDAASYGMDDIVGWRRRYRIFLGEAREVSAPSSDTARRIEKYAPELSIVPRPHREATDLRARRVAEPYQGGTLRVAVIGAIGPHKGADVLRACAEDAERRGLPIHFVVIGYTSIPELGSRSNVTVTGAYQEHEVYDRLAEAGTHVAFLPSVWPETFCYTLSIAIASKLPVCVFDMGAPAERLRQAGNGTLIPLSMMSDAGAINDLLLNAAPAVAAE